MNVKKSTLEPGYIFAPYIFVNIVTMVSSGSGGMGPICKSYIRKDKLNKIFNLGFIIDSVFNPKMGIKSRYSTAKINNNYYGHI